MGQPATAGAAGAAVAGATAGEATTGVTAGAAGAAVAGATAGGATTGGTAGLTKKRGKTGLCFGLLSTIFTVGL